VKPVIGITCGTNDDVLRVRRDYVSAVYNSGGIPVLLPIVEQASSLTNVFDGLLLTGGGDIPADYIMHGSAVPPEVAETLNPEKKERMDFEISLLRATLETGRPVLAICYGMQLINVMCGGNLFQDIGCQVERALDHRNGMHEIELVGWPNTELRGHYIINSSHHQAVSDAGDGLAVFAIAPDGIIEGIYKKDYTFCVGVQWHPERIFYDPLSSMLFETLVQRTEAWRGRH